MSFNRGNLLLTVTGAAAAVTMATPTLAQNSEGVPGTGTQIAAISTPASASTDLKTRSGFIAIMPS